MSDVTVVFTGDDASLAKALASIETKGVKVKATFSAIGKEADKADKELKRFAEQAKRLNEQALRLDEKPLVSYNRAIGKLTDSMMAGHLEINEFTAAANREKVSLDKATAALDKNAIAQQKVVEDLKRFTEETTRIHTTPLEKYEAKMIQLNAAVKDAGMQQHVFQAAASEAQSTLDRETLALDKTRQAAIKSREELKRFADETARIHTTPVERYEQTMIRLRAAVKDAGMEQHVFAAASADAQATLDRETLALDKDAQAAIKAREEIKRFAEATKRLDATPLEKFEAEMRQLNEALRSTNLTQEQFDRAAKRAKDTLDRESLALDRTAQEAKKAKDELQRFIEQTKRIEATPLEKYRAKMVELNHALTRGGMEFGLYSKAVQRAKNELEASNTATGKAPGIIGGLVSSLGSAALGYISLSMAISGVNQELQKQKQFALDAAATQKTIAQAETEAITNMGDRTREEKRKVLEEDVPRIQEKTSFPDAVQLVESVSRGISSPGATLPEVVEYTEKAAELNRGTPAKLPAAVVGGMAVGHAVGEQDAEKNIAFAMDAAAESLVYDPERFTKALAPTIKAGIKTSPGQDPHESARMAAALIVYMGEEGHDPMGESSMTSSVKLMIDAANSLKTSPKQAFEEKKKQLDEDLAAGGLEKKEYKQKLENARKEMLSAPDIKDSGNLFGRIDQLLTLPEKRAEIVKAGETRYKPAVESLLTDPKQLEKLKGIYDRIDFDPGTYKENAAQQKDLTANIRQMNAQAKSDAIKQSHEQRPELGAEGLAEKTDVLARTETRGIGGAISGWVDERLGEIERYTTGETAVENKIRRIKRRESDITNELLYQPRRGEAVDESRRDRGTGMYRRPESQLPPTKRADLEELRRERENLESIQRSTSAIAPLPAAEIPQKKPVATSAIPAKTKPLLTADEQNKLTEEGAGLFGPSTQEPISPPPRPAISLPKGADDAIGVGLSALAPKQPTFGESPVRSDINDFNRTRSPSERDEQVALLKQLNTTMTDIKNALKSQPQSQQLASIPQPRIRTPPPSINYNARALAEYDYVG